MFVCLWAAVWCWRYGRLRLWCLWASVTAPSPAVRLPQGQVCMGGGEGYGECSPGAADVAVLFLGQAAVVATFRTTRKRDGWCSLWVGDGDGGASGECGQGVGV